MPRAARTIAFVVAGVSLVGIALGVAGMAARIASYNRRSTKEMYVFAPVNEREFTFGGRRVSITDTTDGGGNAGVLVRYGEDELALRATIPPGDAALPGLVRHADWLTVLRFAPRRGVAFDELQRRIASGEVADRLVAVVREPQPGADPRTFGRVAESDWAFQLHEFLPGGGFATERLRYPESRAALSRRQAAARRAGRAEPQRRPDELKEGTWEFAAALLAMPPGSAPGPTFAGDAMAATGWTLPATGVSVLALMGALIALAVTRGAEGVQRL